MSAPAPAGGVPVRDAATVVLIREGPNGLQTWLLTRVRQMVFAAGMSVFPGGRVDDSDADLPFVAGADDGLAARFGCDEPLARALLGAAVRETFEETGVLLTSPFADLSAARTEVETGRVRFGDLLRENGLSVDGSALRPWDRWITPPGESPRRYDTRFFVGALPDGVDAQDVTSESSEASWVDIAEALEQVRRGERGMLPPTMVTLASLVPFRTVREALDAAAGRVIEPIQPEVRREGDELIAVLPDGSSVRLPWRVVP